MNKEDKELQKHLVDEMMKVSKTNPDVMIYMSILMKKYEELEEEIERLNSIIKEVREYINKIPTQPVIRVFKKELLEILDTQRVDLQEELNKGIEKQAKEINRLHSIIKEAIEYMERYMFSQKENYDYIHLLDILKGVDKE